MSLPPLNLELVLWILAIAGVLAIVAFFVLRWVAFHLARRLAVSLEGRLAATLTPGMSRAHSRSTRPAANLSDAEVARHLADLDRLAWLMDRVIPLPIIGGVGLDALLGLVPVAGDVTSLLISSALVIRAAQLGAPPELLSRLIAIQCIDLLIGAVPVIGDLADAGYHANERSVELLKEWLRSEGR